MSYSELEEEIRKRDERDSNRQLAPLRPAVDAIKVDTSGLGIAEVVERILEIVRQKTEWREAISGI
jgi:cytidylate kinase